MENISEVHTRKVRLVTSYKNDIKNKLLIELCENTNLENIDEIIDDLLL